MPDVFTHTQRLEAAQNALKQQVNDLMELSLRSTGSIPAKVCLLKGKLNTKDNEGILLSGQDGKALTAALERLGYATDEICALSTKNVDPDDLLLGIENIDPDTVVCLDLDSTQALKEAYFVDELPLGEVVHIRGRRVVCLEGFEASLSDAHAKQRVWAALKKVPVSSEPY